MSAPGHPQKGDVIAGKYQVEDVLGTGGMGVVVAARHLALRQRVAVKFLHANATRLPDAVERFLREARAAVAIQSEHVARVLDVGTLENGAPYMVMEYLAGTDFARLLRQRGALPIHEALDFVLQAGEAIAEAHALGIVHRDLKPSNLFLTERAGGAPLVKVLDFGLSKTTAQEGDAPESSLTVTGFVAGSPQYMSPEQVRSLRAVDWRTDIWALGVILYETLTARRPFEGPSLTSVCASIVADTPPSMRALRAEIPEGLEAAVMRCLEKDPRRRLRSVAELAEALAPFVASRSQRSVEQIGRVLPDTATVALPRMKATLPLDVVFREAAPPPPTSTESGAVAVREPEILTTGQRSAWGPTSATPRREPVAWLAGGVIGVMAGVGIVLAVLSPEKKAPAGQPAPSESALVASSAAPEPPPTVAPEAPAPAPATASASVAPVVPPAQKPVPAQKPAPRKPSEVTTPRPAGTSKERDHGF